LEDGCLGNEEPEPHKKCGFIGISNWALDPAKMNRGIFIQVGVPTTNELEIIARFVIWILFHDLGWLTHSKSKHI